MNLIEPPKRQIFAWVANHRKAMADYLIAVFQLSRLKAVLTYQGKNYPTVVTYTGRNAELNLSLDFIEPAAGQEDPCTTYLNSFSPATANTYTTTTEIFLSGSVLDYLRWHFSISTVPATFATAAMNATINLLIAASDVVTIRKSSLVTFSVDSYTITDPDGNEVTPDSEDASEIIFTAVDRGRYSINVALSYSGASIDNISDFIEIDYTSGTYFCTEFANYGNSGGGGPP